MSRRRSRGYVAQMGKQGRQRTTDTEGSHSIDIAGCKEHTVSMLVSVLTLIN